VEGRARSVAFGLAQFGGGLRGMLARRRLEMSLRRAAAKSAGTEPRESKRSLNWRDDFCAFHQ